MQSHLTSLLAACLAWTLAPAAWAGTFTAKVERILLYDDGALVYVYPEGGVVGAPACHGSNGDYTSFSLTRTYAKHYLSALLMAQATGKPVRFTTAGACLDQSVSDTLRYFSVGN